MVQVNQEVLRRYNHTSSSDTRESRTSCGRYLVAEQGIRLQPGSFESQRVEESFA